MSKNIVWRLLRHNMSIGQIAGYAVANLVGLAIVLTAVQFYRDVSSVWNDEGSFVSKDYLSLYNFGFATSRGMPQVSEEVIGMVPLQLSLSGNGSQEWVDARIVGFSSRLNTIAVPEEFMTWANGRFGSSQAESPSRLIVMLDKPGDPEAERYLEDHGYETAGDRAANGRAAYFLSVVTSIVIAVGLVISLLAFFILLLSIYLLLQKNREKIHELMQLGYSPTQVARYYHRIIAGVNIAILIAAVAVVAVASAKWSGALTALGIEAATVWPTVGLGIGLMIVITIGNLIAVSSAVKKQFYA